MSQGVRCVFDPSFSWFDEVDFAQLRFELLKSS
jgi:hypothetical protein